MIRSARRTILLVDSSKFGAPAFICTFSELGAIDEVITDDGIGDEPLAALRAQNIRCTVVPVRPTQSGSKGHLPPQARIARVVRDGASAPNLNAAMSSRQVDRF